MSQTSAQGDDPPPKISIVIPSRPHESAARTLNSLMRQTLQDFEVVLVVDWQRRGAPWARNRGAQLARGEYVLFCDNDLEWVPEALECLVSSLEQGRQLGPDEQGFRVGYAYPAYLETGCPGRWLGLPWRTRGPIGDEAWDFARLRRGNFIHTSSLIAREHVIAFDPALERLQDWDLWLRLALEQRVKGVCAGRVLFKTRYRRGLTYGSALTYAQAKAIVQRKHGLESSDPGSRAPLRSA